MGKKDHKKKWGRPSQQELQHCHDLVHQEPQEEESLKRAGQCLQAQDEDSYQQLQVEFMFLEADPDFSDQIGLLLRNLLHNSVKDLSTLSTKLSSDPNAVMIGYEGEDEEVNICSITGMLKQPPADLVKMVEGKLGIKWQKSMGMLLSQRVLNMPPSIVPKIYECLTLDKEIKQMVVVSKAFYEAGPKKKRGKESLFERLEYPKFEDYLFMKHAVERQCFNCESETGQSFVRTVGLLSVEKFEAAVREQSDWLE